MATCTSRPAWTADALNALVFNGYVRPNVEEPDRRRVTWRDAVHLRSVSAACRAAVDSEEFWRLQYGLLRTVAPHHTAPHRTAPHRTAPHRTAREEVGNPVAEGRVSMSSKDEGQLSGGAKSESIESSSRPASAAFALLRYSGARRPRWM